MARYAALKEVTCDKCDGSGTGTRGSVCLKCDGRCVVWGPCDIDEALDAALVAAEKRAKRRAARGVRAELPAASKARAEFDRIVETGELVTDAEIVAIYESADLTDAEIAAIYDGADLVGMAA